MLVKTPTRTPCMRQLRGSPSAAACMHPMHEAVARQPCNCSSSLYDGLQIVGVGIFVKDPPVGGYRWPRSRGRHEGHHALVAHFGGVVLCANEARTPLLYNQTGLLSGLLSMRFCARRVCTQQILRPAVLRYSQPIQGRRICKPACIAEPSDVRTAGVWFTANGGTLWAGAEAALWRTTMHARKLHSSYACTTCAQSRMQTS